MTATEQNRITEQAAKAEQALSRGNVFETERLAFKALGLARQSQDFEAVSAVVPTLMEARMQRLRQALEVGRITIISEPVGEDVKVTKGCYLVRPPQVGADARRLRVAAFEQEKPIAIVCHEPLSIIKLLPIVAICPGLTLRAKVRPPKNLDKPDLQWFTDAIEALGDFAIDSLDAQMQPVRRLDALLECLDAHPEHEGLHRALQQACADATAAHNQEQATRARRAAERKPAVKKQTTAESPEIAGDDDEVQDSATADE